MSIVSPEVDGLIAAFTAHADPSNAAAMKAYLRGKFEFFGIKTPLRRELSREFVRDCTDLALVDALWEQPQRELHQVGCDVLLRRAKKLPAPEIERVERLLTTHSWWDTVDTLAVNVVGTMCRNHPELIRTHLEPWATHPNLWLRRTAILFQLKFKQELDTDLLSQVMLANQDDHEFFIQKAIGWVLREYAKTDPDFVVDFVESHALSALSVREALKHIG